VDQESQQRILQLIDDNSKKFPVLFKSAIPNQGYFVPVTIFKDVDPLSTLAQEEIFGPVLSIIQSKDFLEALDIANNTNYALTGGIFSRSPENIQKAKEQFAVGNLYINRGITGAYVQRHPFGGFKLSGTGSKAGGVDYLKNFTEAVCIAENTMRRGFTPEA
jgi:RHH-type proline utilization regulon transcriptional repressor/proline dehydrogenase/delta 1-pyrroline-5-carboxylate dehydrogenase